MRRAGKTTFLHQLLEQRRRTVAPERALYLSFDSTPLRIELLQGYVDTVLFRDVVERYEVTQVTALRWLVRQCLRNPAGSFSVHRLHQDLRSQGHALETVVENEIERRRADAAYVKTSEGLVVDFLVSHSTGLPELIQVCADPADEKTRSRETRALTAAADADYPEARPRLLVLTWDQLQFFSGMELDLGVLPAYEWMLAPGE